MSNKNQNSQPHNVETAADIGVLFGKLAIELKCRLLLHDFLQDSSQKQKLQQYVAQNVPELSPLLDPSTTIREAANETVWKAKNLYEKHCRSRPPFDAMDFDSESFPKEIRQLRDASQHYDKTNHSEAMTNALGNATDPSFYVPVLDKLYVESMKVIDIFAQKQGWSRLHIKEHLETQQKMNQERLRKLLTERGIL